MAELQAQLEVEMAKHTNVTDGTLPLDKRNKKSYLDEQLRKKGHWMEHKSTKVIRVRELCNE